MTIKKRKLLPRTWEIIDDDGRAVVGVLIRSIEDRAWLYKDDYEKIIAEFGTCSWVFNGRGPFRTVRLHDRNRGHRLATIARIITGDVPRTAVFYRDGNRLNLREGNLEIRHGGGGVSKRKRVSMAAARALLKINAHASA